MKTEDELRPEYDIAQLFKDGVRGKYAAQYQEGVNAVLGQGMPEVKLTESTEDVELRSGNA